MRAPIRPLLHAIAGLLLALASAAAVQAASIRPVSRAMGPVQAPATADTSAPTIQFTRGLPQPPERYLPQQLPATARAEPQGDSPHPRPRAFRGACNSTTGC